MAAALLFEGVPSAVSAYAELSGAAVLPLLVARYWLYFYDVRVGVQRLALWRRRVLAAHGTAVCACVYLCADVFLR